MSLPLILRTRHAFGAKIPQEIQRNFTPAGYLFARRHTPAPIRNASRHKGGATAASVIVRKLGNDGKATSNR